MRKTITSYLVVLFTFFVTATSVSAQSVQSADRDKINSIVLGMLSQWDEAAYQGAANLITGVAQFDMSSVAVEGLTRLVGIKSAIEGSTDYRLLFNGKVFTGHFVVQNGAWVKESDADDLQFTYTDPNGVPCILKMATSSLTKTTELPYTEIQNLVGGLLGNAKARRAEEDETSIMDGVSAMMESFLDGVTQVLFEIPATTTIDLTYGGASIMTSSINVDLDKLGASLFDGFIASANTKFYKGVIDGGTPGSFEFDVVQSGYAPGTGIVVDFAAKKDNTQLVSFRVNLPGTFKGLDTTAYMTEEGGIDLGFQSLNVEIDVMGQAQLRGGITDLNAFLMTFIAAQSADAQDEATVKAVLAQLNQLIDAKLYYDGSRSPAATIELVAEYDEEDQEWIAKPYLVFASDNSQRLLQDFFTTENFPEVAQGVATIVSDLGQLVNNVKEKAEENVVKVNTVNRQSQIAGTEWYSIDGKRTTSVAKGLKIVRMSDGTVRKVLTK